jgi:hypothetical protein
MALAGTALPFGIREVWVQPLNDDGTATAGVEVRLPYGRTFSWAEAEEFEDLRGDDELVASHGAGPNVEWEIESGGLNMDAAKVIGGGTVTVSGVTPNQIRRWRKLKTDARPYFRVRGKSVSDSGGNVFAAVFRAKSTDNLEGEFADSSFFLTGVSGTGYGNNIVGANFGVVYDFYHYENSATAFSWPVD